MAESMAALLETNGYEVTHAADGLSGLIAFNQNPDQWSVVLVDLTLPHVSGNALLKEMHRISPTLLSHRADRRGARHQSRRLRTRRGHSLAHKPVSSQEILENLKALIHK